MENPDAASTALETIRALGFGVAIDDFGTGFSSLRQLHRMPIDAIKIDRAFVTPLTEERSKEREIVAAIITLARGLGATTVAEGIEQTNEFAALQKLGCDRAQGFLFHRPMEVDAIPGVLIDDLAVRDRAA